MLKMFGSYHASGQWMWYGLISKIIIWPSFCLKHSVLISILFYKTIHSFIYITKYYKLNLFLCIWIRDNIYNNYNIKCPYTIIIVDINKNS